MGNARPIFLNNINSLEDMDESSLGRSNNPFVFQIIGAIGMGKSSRLVFYDIMHALGHWAFEFNETQGKPIFCPTVSMDEERLRKAIEISKTQNLSTCADPEVCESNSLRQIISNITTEYSFNNGLNLNLFKFFLQIDGYDVVDQTIDDSRFAHDVMAICVKVIRYILALIRYLLSIKFFSYIVQALHRICYIPHSFIHGPGNTDDEHSDPFHSITARVFSSRKGNVLLASLSPG